MPEKGRLTFKSRWRVCIIAGKGYHCQRQEHLLHTLPSHSIYEKKGGDIDTVLSRRKSILSVKISGETARLDVTRICPVEPNKKLGAESSGQSPRLRARDSRLWISHREKKPGDSSLDLLRATNFFLNPWTRFHYIFWHVAELFKVLDKEHRKSSSAGIVIMFVPPSITGVQPSRAPRTRCGHVKIEYFMMFHSHFLNLAVELLQFHLPCVCQVHSLA